MSRASGRAQGTAQVRTQVRTQKRRAALRIAGLALCISLFVAPHASAAEPAAPWHDRVAAPGSTVQVGDGVYMVSGSGGELSVSNRGRIGNAGFIVGERGVIVIGVGTSARHGEALLAAIRRVTDKPIALAVVTHTRQEFLFGAAAFRKRGVAVHMHRLAAGLLAARCDHCLKTLRGELGKGEMRGTTMFKPDRVFDASHVIDDIGRPVRVLHFGHASGPGDIAVFDERSGTLFAGGLIDHRRIPDVQDATLPGWHAALDAMAALPVTTVVPGHGPAASARVIATTRTYLAQLEARVRQLVDRGAALSEVPSASALDDFKDWDQPAIHRRNASILFVRIEREINFK